MSAILSEIVSSSIKVIFFLCMAGIGVKLGKVYRDSKSKKMVTKENK